MDTSDPLIAFDHDGQCNHCTEFLGRRIKLVNQDQADTQKLEHLFDEVRRRGRGRKYDCVLGMSGGVDSSYVALLAARRGLRVLAVHVDNGWNSPTAARNINALVEKLNLAYASHVLPWHDFRRVQLAFLRASVPEAETPTDIAIQRALHHHAMKNGVKYILSGGNLSSEGILPRSWHYNARDTKYSYAILRYSSLPKKHFATLRFGLMDEIYPRFVRRIKTIYPLNSIPYNKNRAREELEGGYGWNYYGSKHGESRFTRFVQTYYLVVKHGIDYRRATLSSELCLRLVDREHAVAALSHLPYNSDEAALEVQYVSKKLGVTVDDLKQIIEAPPRWYFDFPNNEWILGKAYDLYRFLAKKEKAGSF